MTPTMEAPTPELGADFDAALDDFQSTVNGAAEEGTQEPTPVEHAADDTPAGEAPTTPPGTTQPQETPAGEGPTSEYQLSEDGTHYLVPKDQLGLFQTNREYLTKVQEHFPTVADAVDARTRSANWNQMSADFLYNGDDGAQKVLTHLSGGDVDPRYPEVKTQFEQGFVRMATRVPEILEKMAPEAHRQVMDSIAKPYIAGAYQHAAETNDPAMLKMAQWVDWYFTGQYKAEAPKFDPNAAKIQEQTQREQQLGAREQAIVDREWAGYNQQNVEGAKSRDFNAELDRALSTFKDKYDPETFADIRDGISRRLLSKLREDQVWANEHSNQFKILQNGFSAAHKAGKQPNMQAAKAWTNDFMTRVRRYLPSIAEARLKSTPAQAAVPRTTKTLSTPARPNAPARAQNGQFTREQREAEFDAGVNDLVKSFGW